MDIIFFGTPDFAVPSLLEIQNSKHNIIGVVTNPDKPTGRGLKQTKSAIKTVAEPINIPIFEPLSLYDEEFIEKLRYVHADIYIVVAFKILPKSIIEMPEYGAVNLHASLLPKYRGAAPVHRAILNGDTKTGVTTFQIENKVDIGRILLQEEYEINPNSNLSEIWNDLSILGAKLIIQTLDAIESNKIKSIKQIESDATFAPKIHKKDLKIDLMQSALNIHNRIRAFSPKPGAYLIMNNKRVKLFESTICKRNCIRSVGKSDIINNTLHISTGQNDCIEISSIQFEGKKRISVENYKRGIKSTNDETNCFN